MPVDRPSYLDEIKDPRVIEAMLRVDRREFVPPPLIPYAEENRPLPIGYQQTISQPLVVGIMTEALQLQPGEKVLEIGTGSGYQAAILAEMGVTVYTVETIPDLANQAADSLKKLGYTNVHVRCSDGYHGWVQHAPYDAILLTAAPETIPPPLMEQLKPGGRLLAPVGSPKERQILTLIRKQADGSLITEDLGGVAFVPFTRRGRR
jgi:protein-L-isoaspartate(D-aspartate) O-methyltransferase